MKSLPKLIVFDVGHGSSVFLEDGSVTTLIDCKDFALLIEYLISRNISAISQVIISHSDADHIAGMLALIQSDHVKIGAVFVNADAAQDSTTWNELKIALEDAADRKGLKVITALGAGMEQFLVQEEVRIELVAPGIAWRLSSSGGKLRDGAKISGNSMSVVLRLHHNNHPVVLLPADFDSMAFADIVRRKKALDCDILIFPHHGGHVSASGTLEKRRAENVAFTDSLINAANPKKVIFSLGRGVHATPRPEIINQVKGSGRQIRCTQLSEHCHQGAPVTTNGHLNDIPARGSKKNQCCGGSIEISLSGKDTIASMGWDNHSDFIRIHLNSPLCTT